MRTDPGPRCPWVIGPGATACGLLGEHDGDHVPYVPGEYFRAPLLHPLDLLRVRLRWQCPLCRRPVGSMYGTTGTVFAPRGVPPVTITLWEFRPCGCAGRSEEELSGATPEQEAPAQAVSGEAARPGAAVDGEDGQARRAAAAR